MSRDRILTVLIALLFSAGLWWLWSSTATRTVGPERLRPPSAGARTEQANIDAKASDRTERTALTDAATAPPTDAAADAFIVRGRCVRSVDRTPLPGCVAALRIETATADKTAPWTDALAGLSATSAADGTFELTTTFDAWTDTIALRLSADGYAPRVGRWPRPDAGTEVDLGDVPMVPAIAVSGVVQDQEGAPIAGARMLFVNVGETGQTGPALEYMLRSRSDAVGRFAFDLPAFPGEWYIGAEDTGALIEPRSVKLSADQSAFELRVVVERPDPRFFITGTVVDTGNRPLADVSISASGEGFMGRGRSGKDGRFVVRRAGPIRDDGKKGASLSCADADSLYERIRPDREARLPWGTDGIEIVMRRLAERTVRVVDARGLPVTDYTLFVFRGHRELRHYTRLTQRGSFPDGRCTLSPLQSGKNSLIVLPRDPHLASTEAIPFVVDPDAAADELVVTVDESVPLSVHVTRAGGAGGNAAGSAVSAGSKVQLLQSFSSTPPTATSDAVWLRHTDRTRQTPDYVILAEGVTGPDGDVRFSAPPGAWTLRVTGDEHVPLVQPVAVFAPDTTVRLTVQDAAGLHGQLQPAAAVLSLRELAQGGDEPIAVILTPDGGEPLPAAVVDEDGKYAARGLVAGEYSVAVRYWLRTSEVQAGSVGLPVTTIALLGGQRKQLEIDVSGMLPGTVQGQVIVSGEPLREVHCFLRRLDASAPTNLRVATDQNGRYRGVVPPGGYGFTITYPAQPGPGWVAMVLPDEWQLRPGETQERNFDVPLRRVRIRVVDAAGNPHPDLPVKVVRKGYFLPGRLATDGDGWVEVFPAPYDAFELQADIAGKRQMLGPIDLPRGQTQGDVTVRTRA